MHYDYSPHNSIQLLSPTVAPASQINGLIIKNQPRIKTKKVAN